MRSFDFSSWHGIWTTLLGLVFITFIGVGIRLFVMQTIQMRRERENRRINERLRALMAAYKTLGGSFTGNLTVDPTHLRDLRMPPAMAPATEPTPDLDEELLEEESAIPNPALDAANASDRPRRIRDAVEAALSDIVLLGTEEQVRLAARAATELAERRPIHTAELVVSLRNYIREVLNLEPIPPEVSIPAQGPTRPASGRGGGGKAGAGGAAGGGGRGGGGGGGMGGGGMGMGMGMGMGLKHTPHDEQ